MVLVFHAGGGHLAAGIGVLKGFGEGASFVQTLFAGQPMR
jgi:hypothetical protein